MTDRDNTRARQQQEARGACLDGLSNGNMSPLELLKLRKCDYGSRDVIKYQSLVFH